MGLVFITMVNILFALAIVGVFSLLRGGIMWLRKELSKQRIEVLKDSLALSMIVVIVLQLFLNGAKVSQLEIHYEEATMTIAPFMMSVIVVGCVYFIQQLRHHLIPKKDLWFKYIVPMVVIFMLIGLPSILMLVMK